MNEVSEQAIQSVIRSKEAFCKFLSANDAGKTGGHQAGILISKSASAIMFDGYLPKTGILKRTVKITWQDGSLTESKFTWYSSKNELRITSFGRGFSFLYPEQTGSLFVLTMQDKEDYSGFFLDTEDEINNFLDTFGISGGETNQLIKRDKILTVSEMDHENELSQLAKELISQYNQFPTTLQMSEAARSLRNRLFKDNRMIKSNPDKILLNWTEEEYRLFRSVEKEEYGEIISQGFKDLNGFINLANTVLNRRKSRAGKSLEHHLAAIFDGNQLAYTPQAKTEGKKTPDFIFPSEEAYHNKSFSADYLISLAAKTTCKDRWRQVINEADRIPVHHLCTLQQGVSEAQMDEMQSENVILVVPQPYIKCYPKNKQARIWNLSKFIDFVKEKEGI